MPDPNIERRVWSLKAFCAAHGFTPWTLRNMKPEDKPSMFHIGRRIYVTDEAAREWVAMMSSRESSDASGPA